MSGGAQLAGVFIESGSYEVRDSVELVALADGDLLDGTQITVASFQRPFVLARGSVAALLAGVCYATASGVGRWLTGETPSNVWASRAAWYIDQAAGDDEDDGTIATPLRTWDELVRRVGQWLGYGVASVDVYIVGDYTGDLDLIGTRQKLRTTINVHGVRTVLYAGAVGGGSVVWNAGGGVQGTIVDAGIPVSWTASGLVGKLLVMTSGALNGSIGAVCKDVGAKTCNYQQPIDPATHAQGDPAIADTFEVVALTAITGAMRVHGQLSVNLYDLAFVGAVPATPTQDLLSLWEGSNVVATGCTFANGTPVLLGNAYLDLVGCYVDSTCNRLWVRTGGTLLLDSVALECTLVSERGASAQIWRNCTTWNKGALQNAGTGDIVIQNGAWWGAHDLPAASAGLTVRGGETALLLGLFWGLGASNFGIVCGAGGQVRYVTIPTYQAAVAQCLIAGGAFAYAALPIGVPVSAAAVSVYS